MAKYSVAFQVYATTYLKIEADSEQEARAKAESTMSEPSLCWQCAREVQVDSLGEIVEIVEVTK